MVTEELLQFVRAQRAAGMKNEELEQLLITEGGWDRSDLEEAYRALAPAASSAPPSSSFYITLKKTEEKVAPAAVPGIARAQSDPSAGGLPPSPSIAPPPLGGAASPDKGVTPASVIKEEKANVPPPTTSADLKSTPGAAAIEGRVKSFDFASRPPTPSVQPERLGAVSKVLTPSSAASVVPPVSVSPATPVVSVAAVDRSPGTTPAPSSLPSEKTSAPVPVGVGGGVQPAVPAPQSSSTSQKISPAPPVVSSQGNSSLDHLLKKPSAPLQAVQTPAPVPASVLGASGTAGVRVAPPSVTGGASNTPSPASPIKFDLSMARSNVDVGSASTLPASSSPVAGLPPTALRLNDQSLQNLPVATTPVGVPSPSAPTVPAEKTEVSAARTMSSDILLRGKGGAVVNMPAVSVPPEQPLPEMIKATDANRAEPAAPAVSPVVVAPVVTPTTVLSATTPSPQKEEQRRSRLKRALEILLGVILLLAIFGGAAFAYLKFFRTADPQTVLSAAFAQFFDVSSFAYKGQASTDLALSPVDGAPPKFGAIKFSLVYEGVLENGSEGYGDGVHKVSFTGGWQAADSSLSTSIDSDIRLISDALYFHVLSFPEKGKFDLSFLKDNWARIDFTDLFKELQLSGVLSGQVGYGGFGVATGEGSFNSLLKKSFPLTVTGSPTNETVGGVATVRLHVSADPALSTDFVRSLYKKYFNQELALSSDELVRLKNGLGKISGDVWLDPQRGSLVQIVLAANFDDDMLGVHVKGLASARFSLSDFNTPVSVDIPEGTLTLAELRVKQGEDQKKSEMRARDQVKLSHLGLLTAALESYRSSHGRYPKELTDLSGMAMLATSSIDLFSKEYFYRSYLKESLATSSAQCKVSGKECAFYHLGVNLEDVSSSALTTDADRVTAILGSDATGCGGEQGVACYDVVSPLSSSSASASGSAPTVSSGAAPPATP